MIINKYLHNIYDNEVKTNEKTDIQQLKDIVNNSNQIVFFTGAGVSVASGIPDFRSMGGLYDEISKDGQSPEYLLSIDHLHDNKESFINFYHERLLIADKNLILFINGLHNWKISKITWRHHSKYRWFTRRCR